MLLRFRVENHLSLLEEQTLSLIATDANDDVATAPVPATDLLALPVAAIFGANASGKSNIVRALGFMKMAVIDSHRNWPPDGGVRRQPFKLSSEALKQPTSFSVDIVVEGTRYEYGFSLSDERVTEEWLFGFPNRRRRVLFERNEDKIEYGGTFTGRRRVIEDIVRPNSLFLSAGASNNHPLLGLIYRWFNRELRIATDANYSARLNETLHMWEDNRRDQIEDLLRFADLGITGFAADEETESDEDYKRIADALKSLARELNDLPNVKVQVDPPSRIKLFHESDIGPQALETFEESSGTRTWLGIIGPILGTLRSGSVLVIDEIDARLHPLLVARIISFFQSRTTNPRGAQLVFNTHDPTLLARSSEARLRRDQVWLTEKVPIRTANRSIGSTQLVPLIEFRPRSDVENLERRYLGGRYGGLPYFDEELVASLASEGEDQTVDDTPERETTAAKR